MIIVIAGVLSLARAETNNAAFPPGRISLYEVPLVCPAAPEIGCGSRAKPILVELEQEKSVAEAWLNRTGTILAIVWKPDAKEKERSSSIEAISRTEKIQTTELREDARKKALADFLSRDGWYRASDVDRLSEEEAGILATRLVRRIETKISLPEEKAKALRTELGAIFKRRFTGTQEENEPSLEESVLRVLRSQLDEKDVVLLKETLPHNLRPLPGEK
jgi:hypothetical protein